MCSVCAPFAMAELQDDDPMFFELNSIQSSLSKNNQAIVPTLIKLFSEFRQKISTDIQERFDSSVAQIMNESMITCQAKDSKISELETSCDSLKKTISSLEQKIDSTEAYQRRDSIIISGAVPPNTVGREENTANIAIELVKSKLGPNINITPNDISVAHRLQAKPTTQGSPRPPNIYVKLVRRDLKKQLINASKKQDKRSANKIFINESLTPQRTAVFRTLLRIKRENDVIKGVSSVEGDVFVYTAAPPEAGARPPKDLRHRINTRDQLRCFCDEYVKKPLEDFVVSWPST